MTRDSIQGFVDGYLKAGGDPAKIKDDLVVWASTHPQYPLSKPEQDVVVSDLESYRGVPKIQPSPAPGPLPVEQPPA